MKIAIDGPAGAGKSTVAQRVAEQLGFTYIDTGAMYRALTCLALENNVDLEDEQGLLSLLTSHPISLKKDAEGQHVFAGDRELTVEIRRPKVTNSVAAVAKHSKVREQMVNLQRTLAEQTSVVMDGRDIGAHVLPGAEVKFFLTASIERRAQRRYHEWLERGYQPDMEQLKLDIAKRDKTDSERASSPLKQADDAIVVDTSELTIDQVVIQIIEVFEMKIPDAK